LADFQSRIGEFEERGALVVAASVDGQADAKTIKSELGLSFPLGYRLKADDIAQRYGAFYHGKRQFLHATGFLVGPDGKIRIAAYSTGSIGRLTPPDALRLLDYFQEREATG
jgi:alkyl hydroperoxide reductase subunit AhpC